MNGKDCCIHPSSVISPSAVLGEGVHVGPYSVIGDNVTLGDGCVLQSHVVIEGKTEIGSGNHFSPFCVIGLPPQDLKHKGEDTALRIGSNNVFREHVTVNTGTVKGGGLTLIGDRCYFLFATHIAHDCRIGNGVVISGNSSIAGHCIIDDNVVISGHSAIVQYTHIGCGAFVGASSKVARHVPPFFWVTNSSGHNNKLGINLVGLRRRKTDRLAINQLRKVFKILFVSKEEFFASRLTEAKAALPSPLPEVKLLFDFIDRVNANKLPSCGGGVEIEDDGG